MTRTDFSKQYHARKFHAYFYVFTKNKELTTLSRHKICTDMAQ